MWKRAASLVLLYVVGAVAVCGWSLSHVLSGTVGRENAAGVIVFPLAWIFGYWGVAGPLVMAHRVWRLQATLEEYVARRAAGLGTAASEEELEDTLTLLALEENPIPERWARRLVRGALRRSQAEGSG